MGSLIDTSIFIACERGMLDLEFHIEANAGEDYFMSVITASELIHGIHRALPQYRRKRTAAVEQWIERFAILDVDLPIAREHARLFADLKASGQVIGAHDQWLAATCLNRRLKMITSDVRDFGRISGLETENWSEEL